MKNSHSSLILVSASPRRRDLLTQAGINIAAVAPADIDETPAKAELPKDYALRLAKEKAHKGAAAHKGACVLAADTVVACGRTILPKAEDAETARACLEKLSGRRHAVITAVCIIGKDGKAHLAAEQTTVHFKRMTSGEIETYIQSKEWEGKAGGYAIQGLAGAYIKKINGCYFNVVGLPLYRTMGLLMAAGFFHE